LEIDGKIENDQSENVKDMDWYKIVFDHGRKKKV
jgi:hypothetical protein